MCGLRSASWITSTTFARLIIFALRSSIYRKSLFCTVTGKYCTLYFLSALSHTDILVLLPRPQLVSYRWWVILDNCYHIVCITNIFTNRVKKSCKNRVLQIVIFSAIPSQYIMEPEAEFATVQFYWSWFNSISEFSHSHSWVSHLSF